jgi:hypothetical protein
MGGKRRRLSRASFEAVREREPTSTTEDLRIEVDAKTYRGQLVVLRISDEEIRQEIRYGLLRQVDPDVYRTHEGDFMRAKAREIMWRLVKQSKAQGMRKPVKLERTDGKRPSSSGAGPEPVG